MLFTEYLVFAGGIGWLVALMMAAMVPSLPGGWGRRHAGWLYGFCVSRILTEVAGIAALDVSADPLSFGEQAWRPLAAIVSAMLLWEFARRVWNDQGRRRVPATTHVIAAECLAMVIAVMLALEGAARPAWFQPIALAAAVLPGALGFGATLLLWRSLDGDADLGRRVALRTAALGLGAFALFNEMPGLSAGEALPPWIVVGGLASACAALPAVRTRFTVACGVGLFLAVVIGPFLTGVVLENITTRQHEQLRARAATAAAALHGPQAAGLAPAAVTPQTTAWLLARFREIRAADPLLHEITLWKIRGERVHALHAAAAAGTGFTDERDATTTEKTGVARGRSFVTMDGAPGTITAHAPVRVSAFDSAEGWLALTYPGAYWSVQRAYARRGGLALCAALAAFCGIGFVLAARHALENAQHLAIERAQSADKAKTEFLAFLSHEMRTPLQTILGRAELLRAPAIGSDEVRRHAGAIETQGQLLLRLVTDLLDLGTLEAGKFQLRPHPFSLRQAIAAVEDMSRARAEQKGLALEIEIGAEVPDALIGDEARLRQVLGNIVGNAVKYTPGGRVSLRVTRAAGDAPAADARLRFAIEDTGPGLPPEKIPQLFTLFTRLDAGGTFTREGTGVGLALVRRLCELMGGTVSAENRPERGARFTVELPFAVAAAAPAPTGSAASGAGGSSLRVLVAEDNAAAREFLIEALQALGHRASGVVDGPAALAAAASQRFDAVLLDVNLPGRDGISIAATLASAPRRPRLIGCSAEAFAHTREAALAAGMDAFLEKPVTIAALSESLAPIMARPAAAAEGANLFERLRKPELVAQSRALLARDLPATLASLQAAHARGDAVALQREAHALHSTALLADDAVLAELCRRLERDAAAGCDGEASAILLELAAHAGAAAVR